MDPVGASRPWLSVVVPTYNGAAHLAEALESIRVQSDDGIEVIAVDDGSTDATPDILERFARSMPLRVVRSDHVGNWVAVTNRGLRMALGAYCSFLHQDDLWMPGRMDALDHHVAAGTKDLQHVARLQDVEALAGHSPDDVLLSDRRRRRRALID